MYRLPVNTANRDVRQPEVGEDQFGRKPSHRDEYPWKCKVDLFLEIPFTGRYFIFFWNPVFWWPAFDNTCDKYPVPLKTDRSEQIFEHGTCTSNKWPSCEILISPRSFSDKKQFGGYRAFTRDGIGACQGKPATGTCRDVSVELPHGLLFHTWYSTVPEIMIFVGPYCRLAGRIRVVSLLSRPFHRQPHSGIHILQNFFHGIPDFLLCIRDVPDIPNPVEIIK